MIVSPCQLAVFDHHVGRGKLGVVLLVGAKPLDDALPFELSLPFLTLR